MHNKCMGLYGNLADIGAGTRITAEELQKIGEDLKRLISVRGAYRGHCTRAIKAANEIMESYLPNLDALEDVFEGLQQNGTN